MLIITNHSGEENEKDIEKIGGVNETHVYFLELNSLTYFSISSDQVLDGLQWMTLQNLCRLDLPGFLLPK